MLNVYRRMNRGGLTARMLLQIHDELVFEAPPGELPALAALVREEMTTPVARAMGLQVPLKVDLAAGPNWLDVKEINHEIHEIHEREDTNKGNNKQVSARGRSDGG
jgi:DNA polymerase-1